MVVVNTRVCANGCVVFSKWKVVGIVDDHVWCRSGVEVSAVFAKGKCLAGNVPLDVNVFVN